MKIKKTRLTKAKIIGISKDLKTVKVSIPRVVISSLYKKRLHLETTLFADAKGVSKSLIAGGFVEITTCRPISKTKSWKIVNVLDSH